MSYTDFPVSHHYVIPAHLNLVPPRGLSCAKITATEKYNNPVKFTVDYEGHQMESKDGVIAIQDHIAHLHPRGETTATDEFRPESAGYDFGETPLNVTVLSEHYCDIDVVITGYNFSSVNMAIAGWYMLLAADGKITNLEMLLQGLSAADNIFEMS